MRAWCHLYKDKVCHTYRFAVCFCYREKASLGYSFANRINRTSSYARHPIATLQIPSRTPISNLHTTGKHQRYQHGYDDYADAASKTKDARARLKLVMTMTHECGRVCSWCSGPPSGKGQGQGQYKCCLQEWGDNAQGIQQGIPLCLYQWHAGRGHQ